MSLNEKQKEEIRKELEKEMDRYAGGCANCNAGFYITERNALDVAIKFLDTHTTKAVEDKVEEIREEIDGMKEVYTEDRVDDLWGYKKGDVKSPIASCCNEMIDEILSLPALINNKQGNE